MQYGAEVVPYHRVLKSEKETKKKVLDINFLIKAGVYFIGAFLISRVLLINLMAPFGIALMVSVSINKEEKIPLICGAGSLLGYITLYNNVKNLGAYMIIVGTLTLFSYLFYKLSKRNKLIIIYSTIFIEFSIYKVLVMKLTPGVAVSISCFESLCLFPIYYIINYSIKCFKDLKTKHLFSNEELISMAITISLIISGTWGASIHGVEIRNICALTFIMVIGYIKGSSIGSSIGVALGVIMGMSTNNMLLLISIYGLCGLIIGVFKGTGKILSSVAFTVAFCIILIYSHNIKMPSFMEAGVGLIAFLALPNKVYEKLALELDFEKKQAVMNENYGEKIKNIFIGKLTSFSSVLFNMSNILENLVDNEKLTMKNKSMSLIENLADRVCDNCNLNCICWKRESFFTYSAFEELIRNYQENKRVIPNEIERKCIMKSMLIKNTEEIVNEYVIGEMWRNRLSEGRELLAGQINNMAGSINEIVDEFNVNTKFNSEAEELIRRILDKKRIAYSDVVCYENKNDRLIVKLSMSACGGTQLCVKEVLPLFNEVLKRLMCVSDDGCSINPETNKCNITFEEAPKFHISSYVERCCKDGEKYNGDSYTFGKLADGNYITIISDGMGCGPQAGQESTAVIELIEKFTKSGFSKETAINTVNSIMTLKFSSDEKFSTVDLSCIDLYTGNIEFMKVGGVTSFIKSGNKVEVIKSKTLPIGVLDKPDVEVTEKKVKNGDFVIMISDGVLDYNNDSAGKDDWVTEFLKNTNNHNHKELCTELINKAIKLGGGKAKDDMTVIISKVYSLY